MGVMGLVNLAVNAQHRDHISEKVDLILPLLQSRDTETLISTLTLLYCLHNEGVTDSALRRTLQQLHSESQCKRTTNLLILLLRNSTTNSSKTSAP